MRKGVSIVRVLAVILIVILELAGWGQGSLVPAYGQSATQKAPTQVTSYTSHGNSRGSAAGAEGQPAERRERAELTAPPSSSEPAMAYDAEREVTVLYVSPCSWDLPSHPTWQYDGTTWYPVTTTRTPCLGWGYVMTYDRSRSLTILSGLRGNYYGETWEYDGTGWTKVTYFPLYGHGSMVYDEARERIVAFGGKWCERPGCTYLDETWEYTGTTWVEIATTHAPSERAHHAMVYDSNRGVTVLFGGYRGHEETTLDDTWEYDGLDWHIRAPAHRPPARSSAAMAYDDVRGVVVLFGGYDAQGNLLDDTWEYDGRDWRLAASNLSSTRAGHAMVYDQARQAVVLYGGRGPEVGQSFGDTWEYDGSAWRPVAVPQQPTAPPTHPYPHCPSERPEDAGTFHIMPIADFGQNDYGCGSGENDWSTLCCGCWVDGQGYYHCPASCWEPGGNQDLIDLQDMKDRLGARYSNPNVRIGFSAPIPYLGFVDQGNDYHFNENILRYILAIANVSDTPVLIHLNGQQWAGSGWPGYGQLTPELLGRRQVNMHLPNPDDPNTTPLPWYDASRDPRQDISPSDINLTSPDLNWILRRDFQQYKERNLKEAICWLNHFRGGSKGHLLVGISLDSEIGMSSLYAARPDLEYLAPPTCGPQHDEPCNYNPWDVQVPFDYQDQFEYRGEYQQECASSPAPDPKYCTGGMRHDFADEMLERFVGNMDLFNATMGTTLGGWYARHDVGSPDHFRDGYSVQNNPPLCQYDVPGHAPWRCVYLPQATPVPYNQEYINAWTEFRQHAIQRWLQRVADWTTCSANGNTDHLWPCPLADGGCTASGGFPPKLVFTHQASDPEPKDHFCSPIWTAQVANAQVGLTTYDLQAASMTSDSDPPVWDDAYYTTFFRDVRNLADGQAGRYRWGFFEWNTIDWDCHDPGYSVQYQTLENLYNCGVNIICPYRWPDNEGNPCDGGGRPYAIRDTSLEVAIRDFVDNHPYEPPCQSGECIFLPIVLRGHRFGGMLVPTPAPLPDYPPSSATSMPLVPPPVLPASYPPPPTPSPYPTLTPQPTPTPAPTPTPTPPPGDTTPPESFIAPLPDFRNTSSFDVTWFGRDDKSGVAEFYIQHRDGVGGEWMDWLSYPIPFFASFENTQDGHTYYFRCRARDNAGNLEPWPANPDYDTFTTVDLTPPTSEVADLPPYSQSFFTVSWSGQDGTSGIVGYDVQVCRDDCAAPTGAWSGWLTSTTETSAVFHGGQDGHTYHFRSRAHDRAGNTESWPGLSDAFTLVDTVPPTSEVADLPSHSRSPFPVTWSGQDSASGVADYDVQVCRVDCTLPKDAVWVDWITATTDTEAPFTGEDGMVYYRSRARDNAGNEESYSKDPDAFTSIDTTPPSSQVDDLPSYSRPSFIVSWAGWDALSGVESYDIQVCPGDCPGPTGGGGETWRDWLTATAALSATFSGGEHGRTYSFRSRARDRAGNLEPYPNRPDAFTTVDAIPPTSRVDDLPPYSSAAFTVAWNGEDDSSGVASFDVQFCRGECADPNGPWAGWLTETAALSATFSQGEDGQTYFFRSRARDLAGNTEDWPSLPDASTTVDASPPTSQVEPLPDYSPATFTVTWAGEDLGSGLAGYDLQVCAHAAPSPDCWQDWLTRITATVALFTGTHGQTYAFRCRAYDAAGNLEAYPSTADALTQVDGEGPQTWMEPPLALGAGGPFLMRWDGWDEPAGLASFDLYVRDEAEEAWTSWLQGVTVTQAFFTGTAGHTYHFCVRGVDGVGNVEDKGCPGAPGGWPITGEAVVACPPTSWVQELPPVAPSNPFLVHWSSAPQGVAYDVQVMDLAEGQWQDWLRGTAETSAWFTGVPSHTYAFRCRVASPDGQEPLEPWPWGYDTLTTAPTGNDGDLVPRVQTLSRNGPPRYTQKASSPSVSGWVYRGRLRAF